jgi:protocatechuate 3,4-dioxygenase beta subunit
MRFAFRHKSNKVSQSTRIVAGNQGFPPLIEQLEQRQLLSAAVTGQVTDSYGAPLAGVKVRLIVNANHIPGTSPKAQQTLDANYLASNGYGISAITDSNGDYVINDVLAGSYYIKVNKQDYRRATTDPITVAAGSNTAPTVELFPIAEGTVTGQIVDSYGNPLSGAEVVAQVVSTFDNSNAYNVGRFTATTDANGDYEIDNIPAGTYGVGSFDKGYAGSNSSATFTVNAGSNSAPTVTLTQIIHGKVTGQITDDQGNPLAGVSVVITAQSTAPVQFIAQTNSQGDYTIKNIPAGSYAVTASDQGYTSAKSATFTVAAGANVAPTVQITPIVFGTVTGEITDASGDPLAGASVYILAAGTTFPLPPVEAGGTSQELMPDSVAAGTTNSSGEFTLNDVPVGSYEIAVSDNGYEDYTSAAFTVASGENTVPTISLTTTATA